MSSAAAGRDASVAEGLVVVDKPPGCTSHDVVAACRRIYRTRRVGHAGTLDPDATGVLCVGVGRVTRLLRFVGDGWKSYTAEVVFGTATDTMDDSGRPTGVWDMTDLAPEAVLAAAQALTGPIEQVPPMVSAVRVGGRRLHQLAREGVVVERAARPVVVRSLRLRPSTGPLVWLMDVTCSTGTFVRVLGHDLGAMLGGGAHIRKLRRTAVGPFGIAQAIPLQRLAASPQEAAAALLGPLEAVAGLPWVRVPDEMVTAVGNGAVFAPDVFSRFPVLSPDPIGHHVHGQDPGPLTAVGTSGAAGPIDTTVPEHCGGDDAGPGGRMEPIGRSRGGDTWAVVGPQGKLLAVYGRSPRGVKPLVVMNGHTGSD